MIANGFEDVFILLVQFMFPQVVLWMKCSVYFQVLCKYFFLLLVWIERMRKVLLFLFVCKIRPIQFVYVWNFMCRQKVLQAIIKDLDVANLLLIRYHTFVRCWRKGGCVGGQGFVQLLQTSGKHVIQLGGNFYTIFSVSLVYYETYYAN